MVSGVKKPSTSSEIALPSSLPISSTGCLRRCYTSGDYTRGPQGGSALAQASSYEREVLCFSTDGRADDSPGSSVARCSRVLICRCSSSAWAMRFGGRGPYHEHCSGAVHLCSSKLWIRARQLCLPFAVHTGGAAVHLHTELLHPPPSPICTLGCGHRSRILLPSVRLQLAPCN